MAEVVDMNTRRPHIVIHNEVSNKAHVIPIAMFESFVSGKLSLTDIDYADEIMRVVVDSWLTSLGL